MKSYDENLDEVAMEKNFKSFEDLELAVEQKQKSVYWIATIAREAAERYATQFKQDFTKSCGCKEGESTGEMWCCNNCGLPVKNANKRQVELPTIEQIEAYIRIHSPYPLGYQGDIDWKNGFERGTDYVRDHIKNQINDKK